MTQEELQRYLSISKIEINAIIDKDKKERTKLGGNGSWNRYQFIPYLEINGERRFILSEVNEWLKKNLKSKTIVSNLSHFNNFKESYSSIIKALIAILC